MAKFNIEVRLVERWFKNNETWYDVVKTSKHIAGREITEVECREVVFKSMDMDDAIYMRDRFTENDFK